MSPSHLEPVLSRSGRSVLPVCVGAGLLTALILALVDTAVGALRPGSSLVTEAEFAMAALALVALYLPAGIALGLAAALIGVVVRGPTTLAVARRLGSMRTLFARDARLWARAWASTITLAAFLGALYLAALHFRTNYHRADLASAALVATTVALAVAATLVGMGLARILELPARLLGRFASLGTYALAAGALGAGALVVAVLLSRRVIGIVGVDRVAWGPAALVLLVGALALMRRVALRPGRRRFGGAVLTACVLALGLHVTIGLLYGASNRARSVVERRAVLGRSLVRTYVRLSDMDGDGFAWAWGGGDCNDLRADVHPGARDPRGDGVDADCFDGDGSRSVSDFGWGAFGPRPAGLGRPNFVLVTIDALRPDHLGVHGYERPTSPRIDEFARAAVRFDRAYAQSSRSMRSIPALMTGFYPSQISFGQEYLYPTLRDENVTLAEALKSAGWATAVTMGTDYFIRTAQFFQGFDDVNQIRMYRPPRHRPVADGLAQIRRLRASGKPWFVWIHLFNVHEEYLWDRSPSRFGEQPVDKYDTEITHADREVGVLLDALKTEGLDGSTVVVVASDHGEAFGEHGNFGHHGTLYEEEIRATLIVKVPGVAPRVVAEPVALMDLTPTLLNLADVRVPKAMPARSLVPLMLGTGTLPPDRLLFAELMPDGLFPFDLKSIRRGNMKLHWWVREGTFQLYDLAADPGETNDLSDERRVEAMELLGLVRAWTSETHRPDQRNEDVIAANRLASPPARMTHPLNVRYPGYFTLLGYDLPQTEYRFGERVRVTFYYRVDERIRRNLFFEVTFEPPPGYSVPPHFHAAHYPMNGRYFTYDWNVGEILRDECEMVIPPDLRTPVDLRLTLVVREGAERIAFEPNAPADLVLRLANVSIR